MTPGLIASVAECTPRRQAPRFHVSWWSSVALVMTAAAVLWIFRLSGPIDLRYDAGVYYVLGTSLATGEGYRITSEPGAPVSIQYPPGLPAVVAVHQFLLGTTDPAVVAPVLRRTFMVLFFAFALAVLALARRLAGPIGGLIATGICLLQVNTVLLSDMLFTELPFTLLAVSLGLWLMNPWSDRHPAAREIGGFLMATAGFLLRTAGIALFAAWVFEALAKRRWRLAFGRMVLAALPFLLWQAHIAHVQGSDEYQNPAYEYQRAPYQFYNVSYVENYSLRDPFKPEMGEATAGEVAVRIVNNLRLLPPSIGEVISESGGFWKAAIDRVLGREIARGMPLQSIVQIPLWALALLAFGGLAVLAFRGHWFVTSFCAVSILLVCSTPIPGQFLRYFGPLCPFLAISAVVAAQGLLRWSRNADSRWISNFAVGGIAALGVATAGVQLYATYNSFQVRHFSEVIVPGVQKGFMAPKWFYHDGTWSNWNQAVEWIKQHSPPDAIIATVSPHLTYLRTGRRSILPPMTPDKAELVRLLAAVPVTHVIVDQLEFLDLSRRYVAPALEAHPDDWRLVHRIKATSVYENVRAMPSPNAAVQPPVSRASR